MWFTTAIKRKQKNAEIYVPLSAYKVKNLEHQPASISSPLTWYSKIWKLWRMGTFGGSSAPLHTMVTINAKMCIWHFWVNQRNYVECSAFGFTWQHKKYWRRQKKTRTASRRPVLLQLEAELVVSLSVPVLSSFHPNTCFQLTFMFSQKIRLRPSTLCSNGGGSYHHVHWTREPGPTSAEGSCWVGATEMICWEFGVRPGRMLEDSHDPSHMHVVDQCTARSWEPTTRSLRHLKKKSLVWKFSPRFLWSCMCLSFESVSLNG